MEEQNFEIIGNVVDFVGKKGKFQFNDRNVAGTKRIMVRMVSDDKKKEPLQVLLSESLSKQFRDKDVTVAHLKGMQYGVNELGRHYICQPQGQWHDVELEKIKIQEMSMEDIDIEDLIAIE